MGTRRTSTEGRRSLPPVPFDDEVQKLWMCWAVLMKVTERKGMYELELSHPCSARWRWIADKTLLPSISFQHRDK